MIGSPMFKTPAGEKGVHVLLSFEYKKMAYRSCKSNILTCASNGQPAYSRGLLFFIPYASTGLGMTHLSEGP